MIFFSTLLLSSFSSHLENGEVFAVAKMLQRILTKIQSMRKMHNDNGQMPTRCLKLAQSSFIQLEVAEHQEEEDDKVGKGNLKYKIPPMSEMNA